MNSNPKRFSLKDHLFNEEKVELLVRQISVVYPRFEGASFKKKVLKKFPKLELMERVYFLREMLKEHLPQDYRKAVAILLRSLPKEADPTKSDDDFGDFIYAPYGYFVSEYGCNKKDLSFSLTALKEITTRFSVEGPIRFFINKFPKETLTELKKWTKDSHYHVRRAASEGTRPTLPWAKKIEISFTDAIPISDALYGDKTRYVTRSVANHVNDISKIDPDAAIVLLKKWKKEAEQKGTQTETEIQFIMRHALRTLIKEGDKKALKLLGYHNPQVAVKKYKVLTPKVNIGEALLFSFDIVSTSKKDQRLMIDYILYFNKANGTKAPKTFKISDKKLEGESTLHFEKKHPLKIMTTRKLYPGTHELVLQINGKTFDRKSFQVLEHISKPSTKSKNSM